jgi:hypothetical protein
MELHKRKYKKIIRLLRDNLKEFKNKVKYQQGK